MNVVSLFRGVVLSLFCCGAALVFAGCESVGVAGDLDGASVDGQSVVDIVGGGDLGNDGVTLEDVSVDSHSDSIGACGDGALDAGEACDDGNMETGDGCDPGCQVEPGWACEDTGCACDAGFFGPDCAACSECGAFGSCKDGLEGDGACVCLEGYQGEDCRSCAEGYAPVDGGPWSEGGSCMPNAECAAALCSNQGHCVYPDGGPLQCACAPGWQGEDCSIEINECEDEALCGAGVCVEQPAAVLAPECLFAQNDDKGDPVAGCPSSPECETAICEVDGSCCEESWDQACADQAWMNPACNVLGYACECPEGWSGLHCEANVDECAADEGPCMNGGACVDTDGSYECLCLTGWSGLNCEEDVDECALEVSPCANEGECANTDGSYECLCPAGWSGLNCEENVDECAAEENPCANDGECSDTPGGFECACTSGWEGDDCTSNVDECAAEESPCQNDGVCSDQEPAILAPECLEVQVAEDGAPIAGCAASESCTEAVCAVDSFCCEVEWDAICAEGASSNLACVVPGFECECQLGWTGLDCGNDVDECAAEESPCANGAGCQNTEGGFECLCTEGWTGADCSENLNECELEEAVCQNDGLCLDLEPLVDAPECLEPQYDEEGVAIAGCEASGDCTEAVCANDPFCCEVEWDTICAGGAAASPGCVLPGFACECPEGWTGADCSEDIDECALDESPCANGGECINQEGGFGCACSPLWTGELCDENVDECAGDQNPCSNGGACVDLVPGADQCQFTGDGAEAPCSDACAQAVNQLDDWCGVGGWDSSCADCALGGVTEFADCAEIGDACLGDANLGMACECPEGWTGPMCEEDVNECLFDEPVCANGAECANVEGSFECLCSVGFQGVHCEEDVDECSDPSLNNCSENGSCSNDFGSFSCTCDDGYAGDGVLCEDINECGLENHVFQNFDGGAVPGNWSVSDNDASDDVSWFVDDEGVLRFSNSSGDAYPGLVSGWAQTAPTVLPPGAQLWFDVALDLEDTADGFDSFEVQLITCPGDLDWAECVDGAAAQETTVWGKADYSEAVAAWGLQYGDGVPVKVSLEEHTGSQGAVRFVFDSVDADFNDGGGVYLDNIAIEKWGQGECDDAAQCSNTLGAFVCSCLAGWSGDGFTCQNVNECEADESPCGASSTCQDLDGTYVCGCLEGFSPDLEADVGCVDIDECAQHTDDCGTNSVCTNTVGAFTCQCLDGYSGEDGKGCQNVNECDEGLANCAESANCNDLSKNPCSGSEGCSDDACRAAVAELDDFCADDWDNLCGLCAGGGTGFEGVDCSSIAESGVCLTEEPYFCSCDDGFLLSDDGTSCSDINECEDEPCVHGSCTNEPGSYVCECEPGWEGQDCELNVNECLEEGLCNNGDCQDVEAALAYQHCVDSLSCDVAECQAEVGAYDEWCLTNWDSSCAECAQGQVTVHADCTTMGPACRDDAKVGYACECDSGWTGQHCDVDIDECQELPCLNGGSCENTAGGFLCVCTVGWTGELCGQDIDECTEEPCVNGECLNYGGGYVCACGPGWVGPNCAEDVNECLDDPCVNGGACENLPGGYQCDCPVGWSGENCQLDVNECLELAPCVNGSCNNTPGSYDCSCESGWTGTHCSEDINECLGSPCANDTKCVNEPGGYACECIGGSGWTGQDCDQNIDECAASLDSCQNDSACVDQVPEIDFKLCQSSTQCGNTACRDAVADLDGFCSDEWDELCAQCAAGLQTSVADCTNLGASCTVYLDGYTCDCLEGWQGDLCEQDINECLDNPCLNGGVCNNTAGAFTCSCPDGWEGTLCEEDATPELVGSFKVSDGPSWPSNPPTYTCLEACALLFGGEASSYQCSTVVGSIDNQAWLDGWGMTCHTASENYKKSSFYNCGSVSCSESAYISDHGCGNINYCWQ